MRRCRADVLGCEYSLSGPARSREALLAAGPSAARCADAAELEEGHTAAQLRISDAAVTMQCRYPISLVFRSHFAALTRVACSVRTRLVASHGKHYGWAPSQLQRYLR